MHTYDLIHLQVQPVQNVMSLTSIAIQLGFLDAACHLEGANAEKRLSWSPRAGHALTSDLQRAQMPQHTVSAEDPFR
jgi:hypothetical protein